MAQTIKLDNRFKTFGLSVVRDEHAEFTHKRLFGRNAAVGTTPETIWESGAAYTWPAAAAVLEVTSSDNTADVLAGTGAQKITIEGLDANYLEVSEVVDMNGNTAVNTTNSYLRVNRVFVSQAGSGLLNAGDIYLSTGAQTAGVPNDATTIRAKITVGSSESIAAIYTVPAATTAYLSDFRASSAAAINITIDLRIRASGGAWLLKDRFAINNNTIVSPFEYPLEIAAQTDIEVQGDAASGTPDAAAFFSLLLI
jgi:hypothetical protein